MRRTLVLLGLLGATRVAAAAPALDSESDPYPGVHRQEWHDGAIPARMHVVRVDLSAAELTLFATAEGERGTRSSVFAQAKGAQVAINGDSFTPSGYVPAGLAVGDGDAWSGTSDGELEGFLRFARVGERTRAAISVPDDVVATGDLPDGTQGVISGRPLLVRAGQPVAGFDCNDEIAIPCIRAPRTAVGITADENTLIIVVVDGWQTGSLGMTAGELASFLDGLGARDALGLDGGGASTLYVAGDGGVVNEPSDGAERVVANHLAIRHGAVTPGQLVGFIRDSDVFNGANIAGALVTLDDGRTDTTAGDGLYNFTNVSPRWACVTAEAAGYCTVTQCTQVLGSQTNYNSIAMYPDIDCPVGPPDAGVIDAANGPDAPPGADGGNGGNNDGGPGGGGGGGCCDASASGDGILLTFAVAALALGRRRRYRDGR
jgi:uncharacterized protein (TIGR03382 family)